MINVNQDRWLLLGEGNARKDVFYDPVQFLSGMGKCTKALLPGKPEGRKALLLNKFGGFRFQDVDGCREGDVRVLPDEDMRMVRHEIDS